MLWGVSFLSCTVREVGRASLCVTAGLSKVALRAEREDAEHGGEGGGPGDGGEAEVACAVPERCVGGGWSLGERPQRVVEDADRLVPSEAPLPGDFRAAGGLVSSQAYGRRPGR